MINSRALILTVFIFITYIVLGASLFFIQISDHNKYKSQADKQQNKIYTIKAERGTIKDRNGEILAYTRQDNSLFADCRMLNTKRNKRKKIKLSKKLSEIFGKPASYYKNKISKGKGNICLERKISQEKVYLLKNFVVDGFYKVQDFTRLYPYKSLAGHVLGAVNKQSVGIGGIEKEYNKYLTGKNGYILIENDVIGRKVTVDYDHSENPVPGNDVILTLNKVYQKILTEELSKGIKKYKGKSGIGIIINPNTGELLALTSIPEYDPGKYNKYGSSVRRNRFVTDTYEPGSTMKSIVMAILLEKHLVRPTEIINTENGKFRLKGAWIRDTHKFKKLTVSEILEHSSNVGIVKLSERINSRDFYKGLRDFGFGNITEVDLPGETAGLLKKPYSYSAISKAFISHGYEVSVTPMQMVTAYSALVNGGYLLKPFVVKKIIDRQGNVIKKGGKEVIRRVIGDKTSGEIKKMLLGVVENGTGVKAQLPDVYVGGKTGTSQKLINGKYSNKYYNSSFIGFLPVKNPKLLCFVLVDSPEIGRYGGQVAAPIFRETMRKILEYDDNLINEKNKIIRNQNSIAEEILSNKKHEKIGALTTSDLGKYKEGSKTKTMSNRFTMPSLKNKSLREAISILTNLGIEFEIKGEGKVRNQSIKPGTRITNGMICKIICNSKNSVKSFPGN